MLLPISVASADAPGVSVKQGAGYTATKISHPSNGLGQDDGIVNVDKNGDSTVADGNADRGQSYAWSSLGYGDWMYVGTCLFRDGLHTQAHRPQFGHILREAQGGH